MERISLLKFILIALALPAQYFITQHWSNSDVEQSQAIQKWLFYFQIKKKFQYNFFSSLVVSLKNIKQNYFELNAWKKWYLSFFLDNPSYAKVVHRKPKQDSSEQDNNVAAEVLTYRKSLTNFAGI